MQTFSAAPVAEFSSAPNSPGSASSMNRLPSVDAYRGFVMLLMMAEICSFNRVAKAFPESSFWQFIGYNTSHVQWSWASLHDMIQPSFTFLVGVVLPFSISNREQKGASKRSIMIHAVKRSLILIFLGVFLRSIGARQTYFTFEDTLSQIGMGYTFLVILGFYSEKVQLWTLIIILFAYWLVFALYPLPAPGFDYTTVGQPADWAYNAKGFAAHWNLNTNPGFAFDRWFLNLFPREQPFLFHRGGYYTLNFIPTLSGYCSHGRNPNSVCRIQCIFYQLR